MGAAKHKAAGGADSIDDEQVEDVAGEVGVLGEGFGRGAGHEQRFFDEGFELGAVFGGVFGEKGGFRFEGDEKSVGEAPSDATGLGVGGVFEVEADELAGSDGAV